MQAAVGDAVRDLDALLDAGRFREGRAAADDLLRHWPRAFPVWDALVRAAALAGDMGDAHAALAHVARHFDQDRLTRLVRKLVPGLVTLRRYTDVCAILDRHVSPGMDRVGVLLALAPLGAHGDPRQDFDSRIAALPAADAAVLRVRVALERSQIVPAEAELARVPRDHPRYRPTAIAVHRMAAKRHKLRRVAELGKAILADGATAADLPVVYQTFRALAAVGDLPAAARLHADFERLVAEVRGDDALFRRHWRRIARFASELCDVTGSRRDLSRAEAMGLLDPAEVLAEERFRPFVETYAAELAWARDAIPALLREAPLEFPAREKVRIASLDAKILNVGKAHQVNPMLTWLAVVEAAMRQAREAGGVACFVPDWLAAAAERRKPAPVTLSYHTTGARRRLVHFKEADLPGYASLDTHGFAGWSSIADMGLRDLPLEGIPIEDARAFFETFRTEVLALNASKYAQAARGAASAPLPARYVFVALQVPTDRVQDTARVSMTNMLTLVARRFAGTGIAVVVKRHPLEQDGRIEAVLERLARLGHAAVRDDNIHDLIAGAEAVVTTNSGVGSEALIHLKPVYVFGKADYAAVVHNVEDEADFLRRTSPIARPVTEDEMKRFLYFYRRRYLVDVTDGPGLRAAMLARVFGQGDAARAPRAVPGAVMA